jgi:hypothetical protein
MDIAAAMSLEDAQKAAITSAAEGLRKRIDQVHSASGTPGS